MQTVLVVEPSSQFRSVLIACLYRKGYIVIVAASASEAASLFQLAKPDLLIVNLATANIDRFLAAARACASVAQLPVIALSNDGVDEQIIQQARDLGVAEFLLKSSFSVSQLQETVDQHLRQSREANRVGRDLAA